MKIRVAGVADESSVDGPGLRFVLFVQGCPHRCPGCHNPQTHAFQGGTLMDVEEVLARTRLNPLLDGLTLSGGEPFEQAEALAPLAEKAREEGRSVVTYTGYRYEELLEPPCRQGWLRLLEATDILVDGRFEAELRTEVLPFRGSSNQKLIDVPRSLREGAVRCLDLRRPQENDRRQSSL
jgi:anaerobic ribonucleoside-triphosphate reductase activating protein